MNTSNLVFLVVALLQLAVFYSESAPAPINYYSYKNVPNYGDGSYKYEYEADDGTTRSEQGFIKSGPNEEKILVVFGSYSYFDPEGAIHLMDYMADENGFHINTNGGLVNRIGSDVLTSLLGRGLEPSATTDKVDSQ